jgi:hypothetical protein
MGALARDAEFLGDLGLGAALGEQLGRLEPSGLKGGALILGTGRRVVGITGPSHTTSQPSTQPTKPNRGCLKSPYDPRLSDPVHDEEAARDLTAPSLRH